jgi:FAD/FMN-containing dehydrogenase
MALSIQGNIYLACYAVWDHAADDEPMEQWVVGQMKRLEHLAVGAKLNDENMARRPARYFSEAAAARLEALRRRYDPEGRFASFPT